MLHAGYKRILFLVLWLTLIGVGRTAAQDNIILRGYISILNGDPPPGSSIPPQQFILLQNRDGQVITQLLMDYDTALSLRGVEVQVSGSITAVQGQQMAQQFGGGRALAVTAAQAATTAPNALPAAPAISGSHPWVNILCEFNDSAGVPHTPNEYNALFSSSYPGIDHYWRQTSYNTINIAGTTTDTVWRIMPHPRSYYAGSTSTSNADLDALFNDCVRLADPYINFALYDGINMMFSDTLDCCAWGGSHYASLAANFGYGA